MFCAQTFLLKVRQNIWNRLNKKSQNIHHSFSRIASLIYKCVLPQSNSSEIAKIVQVRHKMRSDKIDKFDAGQAGGSGVPGNWWACSTTVIFVLHSGIILIDWLARVVLAGVVLAIAWLLLVSSIPPLPVLAGVVPNAAPSHTAHRSLADYLGLGCISYVPWVGQK